MVLVEKVSPALEKMDAAYTSFEKTPEAKKLQEKQNELDAVVHAALKAGITRGDIDNKLKLKPGISKRENQGYSRIAKIEEKRRHVSTVIIKDSNIGALVAKYEQMNRSELENQLKEKLEAFDKQKRETEKTEFTVLSGSEKGKRLSFSDLKTRKNNAYKEIDTLIRRQDAKKAAAQKSEQLLGHIWKKGVSDQTLQKVAKRFHFTANKEGKRIAYPKVPQSIAVKA